MMERVVRIRIPNVLYKKYKMVCAQNDLSIPKQTAQIIRNFIEIDESNRKMMDHLKRD